MAALARAVVAVCLAAAIGCDGSKPPQSPEQLKGRLDAATGITDPGARNAALQPVARDAADAGAGDIALQAITAISNPSTRNEVAADCALRLAKRGDTKGATAVADVITDPATKNDVKGKIARGA